jgi:hypothetical protein
MAEKATAAGATPQTPPPFDPSKPFTAYTGDTKSAPAFDPSKPSAPYDPANLPKQHVEGTPTYPTRSAVQQPKEATISEEVARRMGMDTDVDYVHGIDFLKQATLKRADNPEEAKAVMEYFFGKGNYGQDKGGRWWGVVNGKKVAAFNPFGSELAAGAVGTAPVTAGAIGGGLIGTEFGPGGSVVGAGGGAAFGKAVDEAFKAAQGLFKKSAGEEAGTLARTAVENAAFEAGGQLVGHALSSIGSVVKKGLGKATPEGVGMTEKMLAGEGGPMERRWLTSYPKGAARPPLVSAAPGAKILHYDQQLRNLIKGNPQEARNVLYIQGQIKQMLQNEGIPEQEISTMMEEVSDTSAAISSRAAGESAVNAVVQHHESLAKAADQSLAVAKQELGRTDKLMRALGSTAPGDLATTVSGELQASRRAFGQRMNAVYDNIDRVVGGASVIPTFLLKRSIAPIVKSLPPERLPTIFKEISELPPNVSIKQMQRYRTRLRELADGGLTPDIDNHLMADAARAADASFDKTMFANAPDTRPMLQILKNVFGELPSEKAVRLLRDADNMYREGIAKYKDATINKIVQQAKSGIPVNPEVVANQIVDLGSVERTKTILSLLTPESRRAVAAADMKNIIGDAARKTDPSGAGKIIEGDALLKTLDERGALLDAVYGPVYGQKFVGTIKEQAKRLAAIDGKIEVSALTPGRETLAIEDAIQSTQAIDDFVAKNPVAALRRGSPKDVDRAVRFIVQPGNEAKLEAAINFYGPQSDVVSNIRRYVLKDVLSKAMVELPTTARTIGGTGMDEALKKFTPRQQELLFPDGLLEDMKTVAKEARFLFPWDEKDIGASMAAANVKGYAPFKISATLAWIKRAFFGWLADREVTIRLLSTGLRSDGPAKMYAQQALKVLGRSFLNSMVSGPGSGQAVSNGP